jgi:hypothetical protein
MLLGFFLLADLAPNWTFLVVRHSLLPLHWFDKPLTRKEMLPDSLETENDVGTVLHGLDLLVAVFEFVQGQK